MIKTPVKVGYNTYQNPKPSISLLNSNGIIAMAPAGGQLTFKAYIKKITTPIHKGTTTPKAKSRLLKNTPINAAIAELIEICIKEKGGVLQEKPNTADAPKAAIKTTLELTPMK